MRFDRHQPGDGGRGVRRVHRATTCGGSASTGRTAGSSRRSYFEQLYEFAEKLIRAGKAYVDSRSLEEIRSTRGDFYKPGEESADRARPVAENLDLFRRMRAGEFPDGAHVLRAKIDMASTDVKLRDPVMYRIRRVHHHRTGDKWCIYPTYDWAHGQSDALEGITHSICTLEFVNHRPLYHWFLDNLGLPCHPQQIEFAKLLLSYTVLSKRKMRELVEGKHVSGWDDPRMPTLAGMRRRGFTAEAIRNFCDRIGVATRDGVVDVALLEHALREDLNARSPRVMAVLRPLRLVIENFPDGEVIEFTAPYDPEKPEGPSRKVPISKVLYIEQEDFQEKPQKKWFRLAPGKEVRLRYACLVTCKDVVKNDRGQVVELLCTWDPASRGGAAPDGRKVKGTLHWVSAAHALPVRRCASTTACSRKRTRRRTRTSTTRRTSTRSRCGTLQGCQVEPSLAGAEASRAIPVRAGRVLLRRRGEHSFRRPRLQSHHHPA